MVCLTKFPKDAFYRASTILTMEYTIHCTMLYYMYVYNSHAMYFCYNFPFANNDDEWGTMEQLIKSAQNMAGV